MIPTVITFEGVGTEHLHQLRNLIAKNHGCIRVFVHPSCYPLHQDHDVYAQTADPKKALLRMATQQPRKQAPIFILEDRGEASWLVDELKILPLTRPVYIIKTEFDDPQPLQGWELLVQWFLSLGVTTILLSGMYLILRQKDRVRIKDRPGKPKPSTHEISGCIIGAVLQLQDHFKVTVSHFVNPGKPSLLKEFPLPKKQAFSKS